jgi:hypothetical protein
MCCTQHNNKIKENQPKKNVVCHKVLTIKSSWGPMAHCNPSHSGSRGQEDHSTKPDWGKKSGKLYREKTLHKKKKGWWSGSRCRP